MKNKLILGVILQLLLLAVFLVFWRIRIYQDNETQLQKYREVQTELDGLIQTLRDIHPKVSQFEKKNRLVEKVIRDFVDSMPRSLEHLNFDKAPFLEDLSIFVAWNGRLRGKFGPSIEDIFPERRIRFLMEGAHKAFLTDPDKRNAMFDELMVRESHVLIGYPMPMQAFLDLFGTIQVLYQYIFTQHYYVYLHRQDELQVYLFLPATSVTIPKLKSEIRNWVLKRNPYDFLLPSGQDQLEFVPQKISFFHFGKLYQVQLALWFFATAVLCMIVGWNWVRSHFECAFWSLCLLFFLITELVSDFVFYRGIRYQEFLETGRLRQQIQEAMHSLEQEYFAYQKNVFEELKKAFRANNDFAHFLFSEDRFRGMHLGEKGVSLSYRKRGNDFASNVLLLASPIVLSVMKDHPFEREETPISLRSNKLDQDRRLFPNGIPWLSGHNTFRKARGNLFDSVLDWNPRSLDSAGQVFEHIFAQKDVGKLMSVNFSMQNLWLFVNRSTAGEPFGIYLACTTESSFLRDFFENLEHIKLPDGVRLSIRQNEGDTQKIFGKNMLGPDEFQKNFDASGSEAGRMFLLNSAPGEPQEFAEFRNSHHFRGWSVLISVPNQTIFSNQSNLQFQYRLHLFLFLIGLFIGGTVLLRRILGPIQSVRHGFSRVEVGDLDHDITVTGRHEGSQVQMQYKKMLEGLRLKRKIAPFISEAVNHLFQKLQKGERKIEGRACMLFSDIRSFTSISEQYDPSEIVSMLNEYFSLWQSVVERENGIIIRFIGDAVVSVFLEETNPDYMQSSVRASNTLIQELEIMNQKRKSQGLFTIQNGIGLAESEILFTVIGDEEKAEFLILGRAYEVSEILEAESKKGMATKIIMEEKIRQSCPENWEFLDFYSEEFPES